MQKQKNSKMKLLSLTYRVKPEKSGQFSVVCLDWDVVYTQAETMAMCRKNAIEVTEMMLELLNAGELDLAIYPKNKRHKAHPLNFQLTFDIDKAKHVINSRLPNKPTKVYHS